MEMAQETTSRYYKNSLFTTYLRNIAKTLCDNRYYDISIMKRLKICQAVIDKRPD